MEEIRKARGWSQADLGEAVGYAQVGAVEELTERELRDQMDQQTR
ncbi:hypothetical protein ACQEU6_31785 [Spirillospora sp. CA-108201]